MATSYIKTGNTTRLGGELRLASHALREVRSDFRELKAVMETMIDMELQDGDPAKYALLETEFGLATGIGQAVYYLVSGALTDMEDSNINQTVIRLG